ncbi:hypothetical protein F5Y12DRAFT_210812 [Xylaria sp. FL1777]|nr:hypothetical protein F5Y12DRAFT_210812 [Xylaria sp. FL1777]
MQGDIFQLESLTSQVTVPKPQPRPAMARSRLPNDPQVAIYNEDDLSHLLYVSSNPHHHHHHHHRHHEQRPYTHPADVGTVLINTVAAAADDMEANTPALSDCDSCCGSETSGVYIESPVTPPLSNLDDVDDIALEAYRRKGRRNAFSTDSQDDLGFPVFLGRQEEDVVEDEWPLKSSLSWSAQRQQEQEAKPAVKMAEIPASQHVGAVEGPLMAWWPEPLDSTECDWAVEKTQWQLQLEREKLAEREREGGIAAAATTTSSKNSYDVEPVGDIDGRLMN